MTPEGFARVFVFTGVGGVIALITILGTLVVGVPWWFALPMAIFAVYVNSLILRIEDGDDPPPFARWRKGKR